MSKNLANYIYPENQKNLITTMQSVLNGLYAISLFSANKEFEFVNEKFSEFSGYSHKQLTGKICYEINDLVSKKDILHVWEMLSKNGMWEGKLEFRHLNGESLWLDIAALCFFDNRNNISQVMFIGSDVSDLKRVAQIKQQFLTNISNELRTPLHGIISLTDMLKDTLLTEDQEIYVKHLERSSKAISRMFDSLDDLSKILSGRFELEKEVFVIDKVIDQVRPVFYQRLSEKNLKLSINISQNTPEKVVGDPLRLKQILGKLLENSIEYTESGNIEVNIEKIAENNSEYTLKFAVIDSGVGIPKPKLDFILQKFHQNNSADNLLIGQAGLGLSLVKKIIKAKKGKISIFSKEGKGTTVEFIINYGKADELTGKQKQNNVDEKFDKPLNVLIAEDTELNQLILKKTLQKLGYKFSFAENGKQVIEKIKKDNYDLILMDMQMPVMDGYETIEYIRDNFSKPLSSIPIISISANIMSDTPEKCLSAGASDYISKPFSHLALKDKIDKLFS